MPDRYAVHATGDKAGGFALTDRDGRAEARIAPARGNNVTHFRVVPPGRDAAVDVLLPPTAPDDLGLNGYSAGNPILFPFPNRVRDGKYIFDERAYQLDINEPARGNHIHGLVSNLAWQVDATGASADQGAWQQASLELQSYPQAARQYPFPCRLTVTTRLRDASLMQDVRVQNTGQTRLPMGFGTHPWFPAVLGSAPRAACEVRIPANKYWQLENLIPTGSTVPVDQQREKFDLRSWRALDQGEYDDVFTDVIRRSDGWIDAGIRYRDAGLELRVEASPQFREWVLYAPLSRAVVCLEPYTGTTNAVNLQAQGVDAGLIVLEPGATWSATIRTSLMPAAM